MKYRIMRISELFENEKICEGAEKGKTEPKISDVLLLRLDKCKSL